jgi:3-deoxy-D-manno-octulosonic-acid transferase
MKVYHSLMRGMFQLILVPRFASSQRIAEGSQQWKALLSQDGLQISTENLSKAKRIWWHAASVGELEILWPLIIRLAEDALASASLSENDKSQDKKPNLEFVITILSESAHDRLQKLVSVLEGMGLRPLFAGYCPWEGSWGDALHVFRPELFITSKYEAWPDLWSSLSQLGIPLSIVSSKDRRSLRICKSVCRFLGAKLPEMILMTASAGDQPSLKRVFPEARVEVTGEPRWDQVWKRVQVGNSRAKEITSALARLPRPWGVLGSAWHEDVSLWAKTLNQGTGSALIVPHRIDGEHIEQIEKILESSGMQFLKSADFDSAELIQSRMTSMPNLRCVLINEMGFLSELYSSADWAYVGGGIGRRGVHSTIEPAIHGIPIACGSYRAHQFVEISELALTGQLTIVESEQDVERWFNGLRQKMAPEQRERWKRDAKNRLGATERIIRTLALG